MDLAKQINFLLKRKQFFNNRANVLKGYTDI